MAELPTQSDSTTPIERNEKDSSKTLKFWLKQKPWQEKRCLGEIFIENGQPKVASLDENDQDHLRQELERMWVPHQGIPRFRKAEGSPALATGPDGKFIFEDFIHTGNATPDQVLETLYDVMHGLDVYEVALENR